MPAEQRDRLPLPPNFDRLAADVQQKVRGHLSDFSIDWDERHRRIHELIRALPLEQRRLLRPPPPPGFESLPADVSGRQAPVKRRFSLVDAQAN